MNDVSDTGTGVVVEEWAGHYSSGTSDKIWAAAYTGDGRYLAVWGRRGTSYQTLEKQLGGYAAELFRSKVSEKQAKGYRRVGFEQATAGRIPSFGSEQAGLREDLAAVSTVTRFMAESPRACTDAAPALVRAARARLGLSEQGGQPAMRAARRTL